MKNFVSKLFADPLEAISEVSELIVKHIPLATLKVEATVVALPFFVDQNAVVNSSFLIKGSLGIQLPTILRVAAEDLETKRCDRADVIQQRCET